MTHDPTITIAGLRAQVDSLETSLRGALDDVAAGEEVRLICEAEHAAVAAERTALAAQLAEVRAELAAAPKGCAIHSYEHGPGPCMTCGAWPPGTRELIAACQARIAGLEQAADERSKEVARLSEQVASARQLIDEERAAGWETVKAENQRAIDAEAEVARLTARVAELEARPVLTEDALTAAICSRDTAIRAMVKLGPVTLPAQDAADAIVAKMQRYGWWCSQDSGDGRCEADMRSALASLGAPPTSPTIAPPEVFAGVSEDEMCRIYGDAFNPAAMDPRADAIRAVLAHLKARLVAPVDAEAFAHDRHQAWRVAFQKNSTPWVALSAEERAHHESAARSALTAWCIPVTPERGK